MSDGKESVFPWKTFPASARFPQTNQTGRCFVNYVDYHRCMRLLDDEGKCEYFKKVYKSLCPNDWISKFDDQVEAGTFPFPPNMPEKE